MVQLLARGWVERGGRVGVALTLDPGAPLGAGFGDLAALGVELFPLEVPARAYLVERRALDAVLTAFPAQVVHTHGYRADLVAGWAAWRAGRVRVSTLHGFTGGDWKNRLYERLQLRALRGYDAVVAVSAPIVTRLAGLGFRDAQVALIPNGWAPHVPPLSRGEARAALGLPASGALVGWVGRLSREKGADVFLDALARLDGTEAVGVIIGEGRERAGLQADARRLGIESRLRWLGLRPAAGRYMAAFDAFVLSSRTEGTPIALLEAMAAGVPVVAAAVGGVPAVVADAEEALLVAPEDPVALAQALQRTLDDPGGAALRAGRARARLATDHALRPWLERHQALYTQLLARRRGISP